MLLHLFIHLLSGFTGFIVGLIQLKCVDAAAGRGGAIATKGGGGGFSGKPQAQDPDDRDATGSIAVILVVILPVTQMIVVLIIILLIRMCYRKCCVRENQPKKASANVNGIKRGSTAANRARITPSAATAAAINRI